MAVTLKQVAESSGVSISTVSYLLSGKRAHLFDPETRDLVLRTADQLGYRRDASALAMQRGRFDSIALLLGTRQSASTVPNHLMEGILAKLSGRDLHLVVAQLPDEKLTNEGVVPKILQQLLADGLLVDYTHEIPAQMVQLIQRYQIPSIWLNSAQNEDVVRPDDFAAGQRAVEHLVRLGHRRIRYVDFSGSTHYSARDRRRGYLAAMRAAGRKPAAHIEKVFNPNLDRVEQAYEWLRQGARPTAVVAYSSSAAIPVMMAARVLGWRVPQDLSVISFDGDPVRFAGPTLTTMLVPDYEVGRQAVELLEEKIARPDEPVPPRAVPFGFEPGATCAPVQEKE